MFVLDFHVNDPRMPNGCKLAVPRLGVLSFYPSNLQYNGLRSPRVCLLPCGSAANSLLLLSAPLSPLRLPVRHPVTPLFLSSQTVCHLIQLLFQADTLCNSPQTPLMTRMQPYAKSGLLSAIAANAAGSWRFWEFQCIHGKLFF